MMDTNQCDELARDIFVADNSNDPNAANEWEAFKDIGGVCGADYAHDIADRLYVAGYRKPRPIETVEELDALPNGSVVLSESYHRGYGFEQCSFQKYDDIWFRGGRSRDTHPDFFLPATVLHEPEAEVGA